MKQYRRTLQNSGAKSNYRLYYSKRPAHDAKGRHKSEGCSYWRWDTYEAAEKYGLANRGDFAVTACQFCGGWHCKLGDAPRTEMRREQE